MPDVYARLARALDRMPNGFPSAPDGVELEILRRIFSPEDAEMALRLKPLPETAPQVAHRLRRPVEEVTAALDDMCEKGQIYSFRQRGRRYYGRAPFIVGIYEFQLERLDREMAELLERYAPTLAAALGGAAPALARVIPVNRRIDARAEILPYDDLRAMLERCRSFRVAECICRKESALLGRECHHTRETCMSFSPEPDAYRDLPAWGREVTREEALTLLDRVEDEGLVHCTYNFQRGPFFVCNCCSCCCGFLRGVSEHGAPYMLARSNSVAAIDPETCIVCGECRDTRCPVAAIAENGEGMAIDPERCIGCGVCVLTCPTESIRFEARPEHERLTPPETLVHWGISRTDHRHGIGRGLALRGWLAWEGLKMAAARRREASGASAAGEE